MQDVIEPLHLTGHLLDLATGEGAILKYFCCSLISKHLLYIIIHLCCSW